jgi:hypothetical protein
MTEAYVVDTNVICVAEDRSDDWPSSCSIECIRFLRSLQSDGVLVLDDAHRIMSEYRSALARVGTGQAGAGALFLRWAYQQWANPDRCEQVRITNRSVDPEDYYEFPTDPALAGFHSKDRKFAAVALSSAKSPELVDATDDHWWTHREAFGRNGIRLRFLCPGLLEGR